MEMEPYQDKAWNILTLNERNSLFLQISHGQSSWEACEIIGVPHYKYLELKERAVKFFKMFSDYFFEFGTLISPNSVIDYRFRDFVEGIIEKRLSKEEALTYTGDSSLSVTEISSKVIIRNMKRLLNSELKHDNRLYDLIIEFDRWNNHRVLPRELQLPSAYKRRNNKRDKTYIRYLSKIPEYKIQALIDIFTYNPRKENKKSYYITLLSDSNEDGYYVIRVKTDKITLEKLSKLSIFIFKTKDQADGFGYILTRFLENTQTPKTGQQFWEKYREYISLAVNRDYIKTSSFYSEKLDVAYDLTKSKHKSKRQKKNTNTAAKRANPEFFYSKK